MTSGSTESDRSIVCLTGDSVVGQAIRSTLAARFGAVRTELLPGDAADLVVTYVDDERPGGELERLGSVAARSPVIIIGPLHGAAEALRAGAAGYATPQTPHEELGSLVEAALAGRIGLSQEVLEHLIHGRDPVSGLGASDLSPRHHVILRGLSSGLSLTAIGAQLGVSRQAVSQTVERLARRAGVDGAAALVRYVEDRGLLADEA
jgi:DNA-binding CsgD family transcriptional regulator